MPDETIAKNILTASTLDNCRSLERPRTMWMKTIQQDRKYSNFSLNEATDMALNPPLWRLKSTFGSTHSQWCMTEMMGDDIDKMRCMVKVRCKLTKVDKEAPVSLPLVLRKRHYAREVVLLSAELLLYIKIHQIKPLDTHSCHLVSYYEKLNIRADILETT